MIEFNQLEQLICIAESGTISKASEKLMLSQPAISRSMQRLEADIEVQLFDHYKNKVILNPNGKLFVKFAKQLIQSRDKMVQETQLFDASHRSISIASCTPAPIWDIEPLIREIYPKIKITTQVVEKDKLIKELKEKKYSMIITPFEVKDNELLCYPYIEEDLFLSLPQNHPFKNREEISFHDMDGETMLLYSNIGFWYDLHVKTMPNTNFLIQNDRATFNEIVKATALPSFTSNLSIKREGKPNNRIIIPFSDDEAHVTFFLNMLKEDRIKYNDLIMKINTYYDY